MSANETARFLNRLLGATFVMGVVTGIPLEFQFGTNLAHFSDYVGSNCCPNAGHGGSGRCVPGQPRGAAAVRAVRATRSPYHRASDLAACRRCPATAAVEEADSDQAGKQPVPATAAT